ncbi:MAG: alpha-ribazole phosphatase [Anaerolineales bacterium]|nr:alpha-ribazole phosphatase [Anaerolineales bacterium]
MTTRLLLVRHGETDFNAHHRFQGQMDIPLNASGRCQASALAKKLANETIDVVVASDLRRASETAEIVMADRDIEIVEDGRLRELNFGAWEGMTYAEIQASDPQALSTWEGDLMYIAPPGGETVSQFSSRVRSVLRAIQAKYTGKTILIVAHGGVLQLLLCTLLGLSAERFWQFRLQNASLSEVTLHQAGAIIQSVNDTSFLGQ